MNRYMLVILLFLVFVFAGLHNASAVDGGGTIPEPTPPGTIPPMPTEPGTIPPATETPLTPEPTTTGTVTPDPTTTPPTAEPTTTAEPRVFRQYLPWAPVSPVLDDGWP